MIYMVTLTNLSATVHEVATHELHESGSTILPLHVKP